MSRFLTALVAVLLACSCTLSALAATTALVRGTVTVDGKPIAGAAVTLVGEGSKFTTTTNDAGSYVFPTVPFGTYRLTASAPKAHELQTIVTVSGGSVRTVDMPLVTHLTTIATTSVSAQERGAQENPPSVSQIDRAEIQSSPVGNSLNRLIETLPGVVQFSYNEPVINGFHGVTYNVDGAPLPLATTSNFAEIIDPKAIDSIELLTGAIPAEYGGDRMGGVVNIITNRPTDIPQGIYGTVTGGIGNQDQAIGSLDLASRFGSSELFVNANSESTSRGIDAPTFNAINDDSSDSDQFLRFLTQLSPSSSLAVNYSSQFSQYQVPINTDPANPYDPIVSVPGTLDTQLEYDRFSSLNWTTVSRDGNGVFQVIPWWRSTRIDYLGDLANDVLTTQPEFGSSSFSSATVNGVGLNQNTYAQYTGLRLSDFRATKNHAWKVGINVNRETATANQTFACYNVDCDPSKAVDKPYYGAVATPQGQAGSQIGLYAQDKWEMGPNVVWNYGLRYDHSTGYAGGYQISPRIGVSISDGGKNVGHLYYGRFYAAPLLEDVRQDCVVFSAQQACSTTNPVYDLKPESDSYAEMGFTHSFNSQLSGSLNVFKKTVVNILDTSQLLNTPLFIVYNNSIGLDNGLELRLEDKLPDGDRWFVNGTVSDSLAACISGSTFLFPPNPSGVSCIAQLAPEDHSQTVDATAAYTHRFGGVGRPWYATLQGDYGSGFPVAFEDANVNLQGTLPAHTTVDFSLGRDLSPGFGSQDRGLGLSLQVLNVFNHQYPIKVANGFNTTQIANGRTVLLRLTAPF